MPNVVDVWISKHDWQPVETYEDDCTEWETIMFLRANKMIGKTEYGARRRMLDVMHIPLTDKLDWDAIEQELADELAEYPAP